MRLQIVGKIDSLVTEASKIAKSKGASVTHCPDIATSLDFLRSGKGADLLLVDVSLDVASLVQGLKQDRVCVSVVAYGINADSASAVKAIKSGAKEYLPLPPDEKLIAAILASISDDEQEVIYKSKAMADILQLADRVSKSNANILITGESGTGKEVVARYIHNNSLRKNGQFIPINCAAIPDNLLESELFGHEKGSFTGATHKRIGKFEESSGGTLLLDEVSEMDIRLQAKLLRAIQEHEIDRVGGTKPIKVDLRVLATSNRNLKEAVKDGVFREDLLFRLNVIELKLPALRERKDDIPLLAEYFINKYAQSNNIPPLPLSKDALMKLYSHNWAGNVRELENTMHRAVLLSIGDKICEDAIMLSQFGDASCEENSPQNAESSVNSLVGKTVENVEKDLIIKTLSHCLGNKTQASNILGISIRTLRNKLKIYQESSGGA